MNGEWAEGLLHWEALVGVSELSSGYVMGAQNKPCAHGHTPISPSWLGWGG